MPENEKETPDRSAAEIEAEIMEKRANLEDDLAKLTHTVREKVDIPARVELEVRKNPVIAYVAVGAGLLLGLMLGGRRAKLNRALDLLDAATD